MESGKYIFLVLPRSKDHPSRENVTRLSLSFSLLFLLLNRMQARGGEGWASEKDKESLKTGKGEERDKAMCFFTGGERRDR